MSSVKSYSSSGITWASSSGDDAASSNEIEDSTQRPARDESAYSTREEEADSTVAAPRVFDTLEYKRIQSQEQREKGPPPASANYVSFAVFCLIGLLTAVVWTLMRNLIGYLHETRRNWVDEFVRRNEIGSAILIHLACVFVLVVAAACVIVFIAPTAGGAGVPEVIAYLNGVRIPHSMTLRTGIATFFSCSFAVASGLPVGPEGPMIHIGAVIGRMVPLALRGHSKTRALAFTSSVRDFITSGATGAFASAFGAPIAAVIFIEEEIASFWNARTTGLIFMTSMFASLATSLLSYCQYNDCSGPFGDISTPLLFPVTVSRGVHISLLIAAIILGVVAGGMGLLFAVLSVRINRLRRRYVMPRRWARIFEAALVALAWAAGTFFVVFPFSCLPVARSGMTQVRVSDCPFGSYSPMATLIFNDGLGTIEALFTRDHPHLFTYETLVTLFIVYFIGSCYCVGLSLSGGFVVPMILLGGALGRLLGRGMYDIFPATGWYDPGVIAVIGAAAFFGGVTRLTISLTLLMLSITGDLSLAFPLMLTVLVARWVGNLGAPSLFHSLVAGKGYPYLPSEVNESAAWAMTAGDIMRTNVVSLPVRCERQMLMDIVRHSPHAGYPVTAAGKYAGFILRAQLLALLRGEPFDELRKGPIELSTRSDESSTDSVLDLSSTVDTSTITVGPAHACSEVYELMRGHGLRRLVVVDQGNRVIGIITRQTLLECVPLGH